MSSIRKVIGENLDQKGTVYPSNIQYTNNSYLYLWMTMSLFHSKKMTFLVLSILCSALFAPVCCIINIAMAVLVRFPLGHCRTFIHIKNHRCKNSCIYQHVQILNCCPFLLSAPWTGADFLPLDGTHSGRLLCFQWVGVCHCFSLHMLLLCPNQNHTGTNVDGLHYS